MQSAKDSAGRSVAAGAIGGVVAIVALAAIAALLLRFLGPRLMPRMMERMMSGECCPEEMRACMEKCGCGRPAQAAEDDRT
jgi:hypothetical protein